MMEGLLTLMITINITIIIIVTLICIGASGITFVILDITLLSFPRNISQAGKGKRSKLRRRQINGIYIKLSLFSQTHRMNDSSIFLF